MSANGMLKTYIFTRLCAAIEEDIGANLESSLNGTAVKAFIEELAESLVPQRHECKGIPRPGCDYFSKCDVICDKCGKVHSGHLLSAR